MVQRPEAAGQLQGLLEDPADLSAAESNLQRGGKHLLPQAPFVQCPERILACALLEWWWFWASTVAVVAVAAVVVLVGVVGIAATHRLLATGLAVAELLLRSRTAAERRPRPRTAGAMQHRSSWLEHAS